MRDGAETVNVVTPRAGSRFKYANQAEDGSGGGDGLYVLAPDKNLVDAGNESGDTNDASYVILYRSMAGKILLPGDAHDETWNFVLKNHARDVADCAVLIAPHHRRKSDRSYEFLEVVKPALTLFGCAPSEDLAYDAWNKRDLAKITNNQSGDVVLEIGTQGIDVYVENAKFAQSVGEEDLKNDLGYSFIGSIPVAV